MQADQLRDRQAPLKTRYRKDPASATVHFEARSDLAERYCVVFQTLNHRPELSTELVRLGG